jgi:hypothetical protein
LIILFESLEFFTKQFIYVCVGEQPNKGNESVEVSTTRGMTALVY